MNSDSLLRVKLKLYKNKGILLYEALIAVVILSVGMSVAIRAFVYGAKSRKMTDHYFVALELLDDKMKYFSAQKDLKEGLYEDVFTAPYDNFSWKIVISSLTKTEDSSQEETQDEIEDVSSFWLIEGSAWWNQNSLRKLNLETIVYNESLTESTDELIDNAYDLINHERQ